MTVLNRREFCKGVTLAAGLSSASLTTPAGTSHANLTTTENAEVFRRAMSVYVADLDQCLPQSALSRTGARYCWRLFDFETDRFQGVMLFAGEETEAAEVSYPLDAQGWHDVYVGIFTGALAFNLLEDQSVWVKLEDDPAFSFISTTRPLDAAKNREAGPRIQDVFWKAADLTGQTISFRQPRRKVVPDDQSHGNRCSRLYVAYIESFRYPKAKPMACNAIVAVTIPKDCSEEIAAYPIDGIAILYNRQPPFLEYESPAVDGFRNQYGDDPRNLNTSDPRWLRYRSQYLTIFMRRPRETLQAVARRRSHTRPLPVTAWVFGSAQENLFYGIDIKSWVEEQLVDTLVPYTSARDLFSFELAWEDPREVAYWVNLTQGTNCQLALNVMPRNLESEQYLRKAKMLYGAGVEQLAFWDTAIAGGQAVETLRRLGHKHEIAGWLAEGSLVPPPSFLPLRRLGDWKLDYIPE